MPEPPLPDSALGPEWMLLELLCLGPLEGERQQLFRETIRQRALNLPELVEQAMRHRLLPLLADALADEELTGAVLPQLSGELLLGLLANRRRLAVLTRVAAEVTERFDRAGVPVAATKGLVLEPTVYGGAGLRRMNDIDLVIAPESRSEVAGIMSELGFANGVYDWRSHQIGELPARIRALYRLSPDHLPHYLRLEDGISEPTFVDFANSLTWAASDWQVDMAELLAGRQQLPVLGGSAHLPALKPPLLFLSVTLHLFRESWLWQDIEAGKDMLYKYSDILRLWAADEADLTSELPALIQRYDIDRPVGWVLAHTDRTFGTDLTSRLGLDHAVSEDWLASARGTGGGDLVWKGSMRERLRARDRAALFQPRTADA